MRHACPIAYIRIRAFDYQILKEQLSTVHELISSSLHRETGGAGRI